jgi:bifunctional DNase/RNase
MTIEEVVIESKVGDVIYCTAKILDNKHDRTFTVLSLVDGLILSLISKAPIFVIKNVWEQMEEFDEDWDYEDFIVDFENEDDDDED